MFRFFTVLLVIAAISACGTNPVTGKRQFTLMSQAREVALGQQQYAPSQQTQGGVYLLDPKVNAYVNRVGQTLARFSAQPGLPYEFVVLNNDVPNAWALPGGKIAINRGLLVRLEDEAQLASVLGHEIVHAAARHGAEQQATNLGISILANTVAGQTDNRLYQQLTVLGATGAQAYYSRDNELEADHYGIDYMVAAGYDPHGAVELQETFLRLSQEQGRQGDWFSRFFASHPPSRERVNRNRARAATLPTGKRNRQAFRNATRQLRKDKPAYDKHQQATKAAGDKKYDTALSLTNQAIKRQPREARFHITKGRLLDTKRQPKAALNAFNRAVTLEPRFFATHLYQGLQLNEMKHYARAEQALATSHGLLPTQQASFFLGEIARRNGQRNRAIGYYRQALQSGGELGEAAGARLRQLGIR